MATSRIQVTEGSGKSAATHSFTEDAVTKELQRIVLNTPAGVDPTFGAGAVTAGTPRHTLASDDPAVTTLAGSLTEAQTQTGHLAQIESSSSTSSSELVAQTPLLSDIRDALQGIDEDTGPAPVAGLGDVFDVTLTIDTAIYADGDVLATGQEIVNFFRVAAGRAYIKSILVLDEDDEGVGFDLIFFNATASLGTINTAPSISDANARLIVAAGGPTNQLRITNADYIDLGGCKLACKDVGGMVVEAAAAATSIWVGAIVRGGTPTYATASDLKLKIAVEWD